MTVRLVLSGVACEMTHQYLFVHERFATAREGAFERTAVVVGVRGGQMLLGNVSGECCFGAKVGGTLAPAAGSYAFDAVRGLEMLLQVGQ